MKEYLGDSVYAKFNRSFGAIELTAENGGEPSNTIIFELEVAEALVAFIKKAIGE